MRKGFLTVLVVVLALGWTCVLPASAAPKNANPKTTVSEPNKIEKKEKKEKKHEGKKKGREKKIEDQNSVGKKS